MPSFKFLLLAGAVSGEPSRNCAALYFCSTLSVICQAFFSKKSAQKTIPNFVHFVY